MRLDREHALALDAADPLRGWRERFVIPQDPDGNDVYVLGMTDVPAGTYSVQVARSGTLEGPTQTFTVADGEVTTFTYDPAATTLTVTTEPPA